MSPTQPPGPRSPRRRGRARWGNNVVMADFGGKNKRKADAPSPRATSTTVEPESWAGSTVMEAIVAATDSGRISRGRDYYRSQKVLSVQFEPNVVVGLVAGSQLEPFEVSIHLQPLMKKVKAFLTSEFMGDGSYIRSLSAGNNPGPEIGGELLRTGHLTRTRCTCPDPATVCKHAVALAYAVAERITAQPSLLLQWRGLDSTAIFGSLRLVSQPHGDEEVDTAEKKSNENPALPGRTLSLVDDEPDQVDPAAFWGPTDRITWDSFHPEPGLNQGDRHVLLKALRTVSWSTVDQVNTLHELELCYEALTEATALFDMKRHGHDDGAAPSHPHANNDHED
ncbi:MAG TPA: hypothetical protein H9867_01470 [Candidatus Corynebacterium gallistercoris]|uniref:SWIM-type domain-containing protein n=1 Tax=Candidatus Corynebacterium gallistercoris TaxID=2838530 RepID=A0A9D1RVQ6_9CORY|nr:hypothetical protein [Candidatus Corynebacterium gallistercoris]